MNWEEAEISAIIRGAILRCLHLLPSTSVYFLLLPLASARLRRLPPFCHGPKSFIVVQMEQKCIHVNGGAGSSISLSSLASRRHFLSLIPTDESVSILLSFSLSLSLSLSASACLISYLLTERLCLVIFFFSLFFFLFGFVSFLFFSFLYSPSAEPVPRFRLKWRLPFSYITEINDRINIYLV